MAIDIVGGTLAALRDLVWPRRCVACEAPLEGDERTVCRSCDPTLRSISEPSCPTCALPQPWRDPDLRAPCLDCRRHPPPQRAGFSYWRYTGAVATAIQRAKYAGDVWRLHALAEPTGDWCAHLLERLQPDGPGREPLHVAAVPMHVDDLRNRGFNAPVQLARSAFDDVRVRLCRRWRALVQTDRIRPQAGLTRGERRRNVRGAFEPRDPETVAGRTWLVVDDVATTGATLAEAAGELVAAGAREVYTLAFARTPRDGYIGGS